MPQTPTPTEPNQRATTVKSLEVIEFSVVCWNNDENKLKILKIKPETKTVAAITLTQTTA